MRDFPSSNPIDPMPPAEINLEALVDGTINLRREHFTMPNINAPSPTIARMERFVRLVTIIVPIAMLILLAVLLMMPMSGCDYDDLKAESTAWRQRSDALQVERDELRAEASQIIRTAKLVGHVDEGALARLDEITAAIGVVSAAIDVAHDGIRKVDDTIQAQAGWFELGDTVIGAIGGGVPMLGLGWGIMRSVWRRRFGQLVANVHDSGQLLDNTEERLLNLDKLGEKNRATGLQPLVVGPLDAAKEAERVRKAA